MSVTFSELVPLVRRLSGELRVQDGGRNPLIEDVVSDSRQVDAGALFCCIAGGESDGHLYVPEAERRGAAALLCERPVESRLPLLIVPKVRAVMGEAAAAIHDHPAEKLLMAGVTGTNGKTTTTYVLRSILEAAGLRVGLLGTVLESDGLVDREADRTTPESCVIQRRLAAMVRNGCGACVMEASSHGLFLGRLQGTRFDVPVFTNLYPEHLDFHKDMENYFQAKRLLFSGHVKPKALGAANGESPYGQRLLQEFPEMLRGYALSEGAEASARVLEWRSSLEGSTLRVRMRDFPDLELNSPLVGEFNVWNVLCAVTALRGRVEDDLILRGVASIPQVPGRLERCALPNGARCFIDFAHTPTALRSVLTTVRGLSRGRLISIFGHGGGRYPMNRPELGRVAAELADEVIITMDNPRNEDPAAIARAIAEGVEERGGRYQVILDRREAVRRGLDLLREGDVMVVSGKGPERTQQIGHEKFPYNDAEVVNEWIGERQ